MSDALHSLLSATPLLDLHHADIEALVVCCCWRSLSSYDRIGANPARHPQAALRLRKGPASGPSGKALALAAFLA